MQNIDWLLVGKFNKMGNDYSTGGGYSPCPPLSYFVAGTGWENFSW
jgi:hypothetical protein